MTHKCQGHFVEHNTFTNKTEKWTGKDGYSWVQSGKFEAVNHPKVEVFKNKWKCKKCSNGLKSVSVLSFDVYFGGGDNSKFHEQWKACCTCGWKDEKDETAFVTTGDPLLNQQQ